MEAGICKYVQEIANKFRWAYDGKVERAGRDRELKAEC